jgi:hypothetical protein
MSVFVPAEKAVVAEAAKVEAVVVPKVEEVVAKVEAVVAPKVEEVVAKVESVVAPVVKTVEAKAEPVAKTLSDLAVEAVKAAEQALEEAKTKAVEVKNSLEAELAKEADRIKTEIVKVQAITEVKKVEQAIASVAKEVVAEEAIAAKGHPTLVAAIIALVSAAVGAGITLLFK